MDMIGIVSPLSVDRSQTRIYFSISYYLKALVLTSGKVNGGRVRAVHQFDKDFMYATDVGSCE